MFDTVVLDGELDLLIAQDGDCDLLTEQDGEVDVVTGISDRPAYTGPTEVTPTQETQVLYTESKTVLSNIVINPIPSNYGLITWNGSTLTVS